jgi:hypothetical protein
MGGPNDPVFGLSEHYSDYLNGTYLFSGQVSAAVGLHFILQKKSYANTVFFSQDMCCVLCFKGEDQQ